MPGPAFRFPTLDPEQTQRSILAYLAGLPPRHGATRAVIHRDLFGLDLKVAQAVAGALGGLKTKRLVQLRDGGRYAITDAGRAALDLDDTLRSA